MKYELAKQLKDAGFPQVFVKESVVIDGLPAPTLEELIEACGERFIELVKLGEKNMLQTRPDEKWCAIGFLLGITIQCAGLTPSEAVAELWLKLNENEQPHDYEIIKPKT